MTKADALRVRDVRDAYRLIGECRDLGSEPALWHRHMLVGLCRLIGATQGTGGEGWWPRPKGCVRAISAYDVNTDPSAHHAFVAYQRAKGQATDPIYRALGRIGGHVVTRTRRQLVSDAEWYRSVSFTEYRRPARIDHEATSVCWVSGDGAISGLGLIRTIGERDFSTRELRVLNFFHAELGRLIRGPLVSATEPSVDALSPRLRQTLACLLEGDSEKQVAARLMLSQLTVHQYVKALYRRFCVQSRAQLLAHVIKRAPRFVTPGIGSPI